ncbi:MAG: DUF4956 domain-containing protein [Candidatus Magasanikbacteria bacterium]|jgi:uncharacterized membrane protein YhiD involved in acid resistance|nr:DUF4956 domain-containing protein [Candidatus Magasanikbacteria bacterium]MBT4220773.1 DUF4956 domain-containing protein [Candidatus Magasanikbacteria bacterium]MBT4350118.1 DUF4956 domain-containing protein [Candidatus Magasanikbacteria bacterium]MBT4541439.1 DUF4956 domain-containing protein [Candidatus Magasanikbacteria bacterium]MBT6253121.1 DUF4956 domain-containing protein [Candidatus Magasanikbacteria bacterium]
MIETLLAQIPQTTFSIDIVILNLLVALFLGLVIAITYKHTHHGISYSQSFVITLVLLTLITTIAMAVIGGNIVTAFALLGTFTIIRFRTAIKDSRDTAFVFLALVVGLGVGTLNYSAAIIGSIFSCIVIWIFYKTNFGEFHFHDFILNIQTKSDNIDDVLYPIFKAYIKHHTLLHVRSITDNVQEYSFTVTFKKDTQKTSFQSALQKQQHITSTELLTTRNDGLM